jgi:probable phosphoglycerate mutase
MNPLVVLVRHGQTEWSLNGRHTGRTDIPLTDTGRRQAELAGARLQGLDITLVLSSPLSRAYDSCRLAGLGDRAEKTDDLLEWNYGEYEGLRSSEIHADRPDWWMWTDGCPGGEVAADVAKRVDRVIERCQAADGDVALFAHGHVLRVLGARWAGHDPTFGATLYLSTASVSVLGREHANPVIARWNDTAHLEPDGRLQP